MKNAVLKSTLSKFTIGSKTLDKILSKQRLSFDKSGLGYSEKSEQKSTHYNDLFLKREQVKKGC